MSSYKFHTLPRLLRPALSYLDVVSARYWHKCPRTLPTLLLFVTYECNLRCAMCGVRYHPSAPELEVKDYERILNDAKKLNTSLMLISGGEALSKGDLIPEIIHMGIERGITAHLCSNGTLINAEVARMLQKSGLKSVSVSIESYSSEIHDAIRGKGSFNAAVGALKTLHDNAPDIRTGINCTISALNYHKLVKMIPLAESLGVRQLKFAPMHTNLLHRDKPPSDFASLIFSDTQFLELKAELAMLRVALQKSALLSNHPEYLDNIWASFQKTQQFNCYAGYAACTIDPMGNVSPCPDVSAGLNVKESSLRDIWRSESYHRLRERVCNCGNRCWDPLYTELSLRMAPRYMLSNARQIWREIGYYFGGRNAPRP